MIRVNYRNHCFEKLLVSYSSHREQWCLVGTQTGTETEKFKVKGFMKRCYLVQELLGGEYWT